MTTAPTLATIADYYRIGLETGLLKPDDASVWATSVIAKMPEPPYEIIEVSWTKGLHSMLEALAAVVGERDKQLAGRWMLGYLRESMPDSDEHLHWVARRGMQIAKLADLGDEIYYQFDMIDDELFLAKYNTCGTVEECRANLQNVLNSYPAPPHPLVGLD